MQGKAPPQKVDVKAGPATPAVKESTPPSARPPRERGSAAVANRILQRDLGIVPKEPKRTPRPSASTKDVEVAPKVAASGQAVSSQATPKSPSDATPTSTAAPPTGPRNSRPPSVASAKPNVVVANRLPKPGPQPTIGAKAAFLKHANASQGVTEELLRSAFEAFGPLTRCEIDKKKGFGYVDFAETEHLKLAMQASPVKVGNGQVVVLENKTRKILPPATAATTTSTKDSGSPAEVQPAAQPLIRTSSAKSDSVASSGSPSLLATKPPAQTTSQPAPPRVPRGAQRGGPVFNRGRGGFAPGRGNFPVQRGGVRGNFRGGRGNMRVAPATPGVATAPITPITSTPSTSTSVSLANTSGAAAKTQGSV
jgi:regulator of nonsense transcripts 3